MDRMTVTYHVSSDSAGIEAKAKAIAVEQSVEMPLEAISKEEVLRDIVGQVQAINPIGSNLYEVAVGLAVDTIDDEPGQFFNIVFGNTSLHDYVMLTDVAVPAGMAARFGGPNLGIDGLRARSKAPSRALTSTALKPQGLNVQELADLAHRLALGGLDYIKDDHNLANQHYSPFEERVAACAEAVAKANAKTGFATRYVPNLSGDLDALRAQVSFATAHGVDTVMVEPMITGFAAFNRLVRENPGVAFFAHPSMGGAARMAPRLLFGKLFRLFGADVSIYTNYGGRFAYPPEVSKAIAVEARAPLAGIKAAMPSPAGGMTLDRVEELLNFYGPDTMLLIGGSLLLAKERMSEEALAFTHRVARHFEG